MEKKTLSLILGLILVLNLQFSLVYGAQNPSHEEVERLIEEVAKNKNIPSVILKAIAWKESKYRQFDSKGNPFISYGNIGIMQVNKIHKQFDQNRLKNDIQYNIEAGADILLGRWQMAGRTYPKVGDMNPEILEHWYFPLWAYNGWVAKNNPNVSGSKAYQEQIFELIRTRYQQPITSVNWAALPKTGLPSSSLQVDTPEPYHVVSFDTGEDLKLAQLDRALVNRSDGRRDRFNEPVTREEVAKIIVETKGMEVISKDVAVQDWDQVSPWAKDYMATMYDHDLMQGNTGYIRPQDFLTREEALSMVYRLVKEPVAYDVDLTYVDAQDISPWAVESIQYFVEKQVLSMEKDQSLGPKDYITLKELLELLAKAY